MQGKRGAEVLRKPHVNAVGVNHPGHRAGADVSLVHLAVVSVVAEAQGIRRLEGSDAQVIEVKVGVRRRQRKLETGDLDQRVACEI